MNQESSEQLAARYIEKHGGEGKHTMLAMLGLTEKVTEPKQMSGRAAQIHRNGSAYNGGYRSKVAHV